MALIALILKFSLYRLFFNSGCSDFRFPMLSSQGWFLMSWKLYLSFALRVSRFFNKFLEQQEIYFHNSQGNI